MKLVIFGIGRFFENRKGYFASIDNEDEIVAFIDNFEKSEGLKDGIPVYNPKRVKEICYDKILLMSLKSNEMRKQLIGLGVKEENIWDWEYYKKENEKGVFRLCYSSRILRKNKKILIISTDLNYNGGSIAAVYAAKALQQKNYNVILAAPGGNKRFIDEILGKGINVVICPTLPHIHEEELFFASQFDVVIVNVFQMVQCACKISKIKPVLWWIHESGKIYEETLNRMSYCVNDKILELVNIYAVSRISQKCFNSYFPNRIKKILKYGIPDERKSNGYQIGKIVFAVIGGIIERKAQDIFIRAVEKLSYNEKENTEFWLIGGVGQDEYSEKVRKIAEKEHNVRILGLLTRSEINDIYEDIDVVVCPSLEDPLPIVVTEGMMYGKVCIVSDATGTADYILSGKNGFVFRKGDVNDLYEKLRWIINHKESMGEIGKNARNTYEQYFTMEKFADNLEDAVLETIQIY